MLASYYPGKFRTFTWAGQKPPKKADKVKAFRQYCQAVYDNLAAYPGQKGYVRDFDGGIYEISRESRSARRMAENDPQGVAMRETFLNAMLTPTA